LRIYKAIFLDRDGTICGSYQERNRLRDKRIGEMVGKPDFALSSKMYETALAAAEKAVGGFPRTMDEEKVYRLKFFELVLRQAGAKGDLKEYTRELLDKFAPWYQITAYPDAPVVMRELKRAGFKIGVISNTLPSLPLTMATMGLDKLVDMCVASSLIRASKPASKVFTKALVALGVQAHEAMFVDDLRDNVLAARKLGMAAFHIDRQRKIKPKNPFEINDLWPLLDFLGLAHEGDLWENR